MSREDSKLSRVIQDFVNKSQKFYPGLRFSNSYSMYSGPEPTSCDFEYSFSNEFLKGSPYEFSSGTKLIHYASSIQNLFDIIKSGVFRLTSLNAKNDKHELSYLTNELKVNISAKTIEEYKKHFFCTSFSQVDPAQEEEFSMWRLYGSEGNGFALVFEIANNDEDWHNFSIGNVRYGINDAAEKYRNFINFFEEFQKNNHHPIRNMPVTSTAFLGLHKNIGWNYENEVRLLSYYDYNEFTLEAEVDSKFLLTDVFHSYSKDYGHFSYMELPLIGSSKYKEHESYYSSAIPNLKLTKIILGFQYSDKQLIDIHKILNYEADKHPDLHFSTTRSKFSDHG